MRFDTSAARSALKLGFFVSSLTLASLAAQLATANISPMAKAPAPIRGGLSDIPLRKAFDNEGDAQIAHNALSPQEAQAANQAVPVANVPNPQAKPFMFRGGAGDRQTAATCLTQAVYYEAGFEPIQGAQAVAQVVLNRVRHPIFPKSVCGVVYQGAELKTGCQFSFTCDGSLAKVPAKGAWDRAKAVAEQALSGFVQKDVGESTHYHTQWVRPWWAPTVTKVAQVGVQIFYRWPGQLGTPAAFVGRYAGNEHMGRGALVSPNTPDAPVMASIEHGRVHAVFAATAPIAAPVHVEVASTAPTPVSAKPNAGQAVGESQ